MSCCAFGSLFLKLKHLLYTQWDHRIIPISKFKRRNSQFWNGSREAWYKWSEIPPIQDGTMTLTVEGAATYGKALYMSFLHHTRRVQRITDA